MPGESLGIGSALLNGASTLIATGMTNLANRRLNQENIVFQQRENDIARAREDNAVQRRSADLVNAGLSQTLAAGSPASANAMNAPNNSYGMKFESPQISLANWQAIKQAQQADRTIDLEEKKLEHDIDVDKQSLSLQGRSVSVAEAKQALDEDWQSFNKKLQRDNFNLQFDSTYRSLGQKDVELAQSYRSLGQRDTELSLSKDKLQLEKAGLYLSLLDTMSTIDLRKTQQALNKSTIALNSVTSRNVASQIASRGFNDMLAFRSFLNTLRMSNKSLQVSDAEIRKIVGEQAYLESQKNHLDAQTSKVVQQFMFDAFDASKSVSNGEYISSTKPNLPTLEMSEKQRKTSVKNAVISALGGIAGSVAGAFALGGAKKVFTKHKNDDNNFGFRL